MKYIIDLAKDFYEFPFGRNSPADGDYSGEVFREEVLKSYLTKITPQDQLIVDLNGVKIGIGSSFLSESFGGAIRKGYIDKNLFLSVLEIVCDDGLYEKEIRDYIEAANPVSV